MRSKDHISEEILDIDALRVRNTRRATQEDGRTPLLGRYKFELELRIKDHSDHIPGWGMRTVRTARAAREAHTWTARLAMMGVLCAIYDIMAYTAYGTTTG